MTSHLTPYINLSGNARDALNFYREVFGGTLDVNTFSEFGMSDPAVADQIMHGQLETESGFLLMCSDTPPGMERAHGDDVTLCLHGDDVEELRQSFKRLSEGGTVVTPLEQQMWGDEYGACTDAFGVTWKVNIRLPQA